jgi:AraC-like DNA-binding protein
MRIRILALNGVFDTGLAAVLDAFDIANALAEMTGISSLRFQTKLVGLSKAVTTAQGLSVPVSSAARAKSPLEYFQDLRIERAVHLPETSQASVDQIAAEVGYAEGVTLRVLLRRKLGRGVREIRLGL